MAKKITIHKLNDRIPKIILGNKQFIVNLTKLYGQRETKKNEHRNLKSVNGRRSWTKPEKNPCPSHSKLSIVDFFFHVHALFTHIMNIFFMFPISFSMDFMAKFQLIILMIRFSKTIVFNQSVRCSMRNICIFSEQFFFAVVVVVVVVVVMRLMENIVCVFFFLLSSRSHSQCIAKLWFSLEFIGLSFTFALCIAL